MRQDMTEERITQVLSWTSVTDYKKVSKKALAFLRVLADGKEWQRTDLFRAAGWEANKMNGNGFTDSDLTDYRLFASGLLDMRATGVKSGHRWNGVITYWTINDEGRAALKANS